MRTRNVILILVLAIVAIGPVVADSQVDIGVNIPTAIGLTYRDPDTGETVSVSDELRIRIPIPDLMYNYYFGFDNLKIGVGARVWSVLLITAGYPIVSAELQVGPLLANAHIGGGIFGYTSIGGSGIESGRVFLPEISALFRFNDWFALGAGFLGIMVPELTTEGMGWSFNLIGRFRVL